MADEPEKLKIRVYLGRRLEGKKLEHSFQDATPDGEIMNSGAWTYPKAKAHHFLGARIGQIYDMTNGIPSLWEDARVGEVDTETRVTLQARDKAANARKRELGMRSSKELDYHIDKMAAIHNRIPMSHMVAWETWLLAEIRKRARKRL